MRVGEKEGVLRFVGKVHFTEGIWCGIELSNGNGKNDGCVRGVRYFACPDSRGLMAPLFKVLLIDDIEFEVGEDRHSGPHSMLFGFQENGLSKDLQRIDLNATFVQANDDTKNVTQKPLIRSETYENIPTIDYDTTITKTLNRTNTYNKEEKQLNRTGDDSLKSCSVDNLTYLNENNFPDIVNSTRILNKIEKVDDSNNESIDGDNTTLECVSSLDTTISLVSKPTNSADLNVTVCYVASKNKKPHSLDIDRKPSLPRPKLIKSDDSINNLNETTVNQKIKTSQSEILTHPTSLYSESDIENSPRRRRVKVSASAFTPANEDDCSKRDSLEFEESLGILTPEQMADFSGFAGSPSSENIASLPNDFQSFVNKFQTDLKVPELASPNLVDASISLGIIDENMLLSFAVKSDTTTNMELPLDSVGKSKLYSVTRLEQTPSPEDLPLDPTPVIECESKTEPTKSKTNTSSSFITSITSITSLDTGYQGDGEMSRPGSRGADHSPLTRRPSQRPQPRRPDPLTDSDFYTESDADNHEEHPLRGDRLARVIDGTLYGVDPQAAADIYVNNRENMDSSGIFTDIEGNTRTDELSSAENENVDVSPSPSDASSKTISNDSQNNASAIINKSIVKTGLVIKHSNSNVSIKNEMKNNEINMKRKSPTPSSSASSPASIRSPRHTAREDSLKKHKMPKRNVTSKVKAALENTNQSDKALNVTTLKKPVGRWDAVMNKITKNTTSLKEIKSKVFTNNTTTCIVRQNATPNNKLRRVRTRTDAAVTKISNLGSFHSSASDLSTASPAKRIGSQKKRTEVVRVTQVLTPAKLSPRTVHKTNSLTENKKNVPKPIIDIKYPPRKTLFSPKEKKSSTPTQTSKDCARATVKGGRASPGARPPQQTRVPTVPIARTTEALAVIVQHLVFNLEAFQTPYLKKQIEKSRIIAEEARFSCRQMEDHLNQIRLDHSRVIDNHQKDILQLTHQRVESEQRLICEHEKVKEELIEQHNEQLTKLKEDLQKNHEQALDILREENDSIREEIDEKNLIIAKLEAYKKENDKLHKEIKLLNDEMVNLKAENVKVMNFAAEGKENKVQIVLAEVESLRAVMDLKQNQVAELRKLLAEANHKADLLPNMTEKVSVLSARCEDLVSQIESKSVYEQQLVGENKKLQESLTNEVNQSIRLRQHNEELQWKLQQNKEVVSRVIEETAFNRALLNSSFNEHHTPNRNLERTFSFRERSINKGFNSMDGSIRSRKSKNSSDLTCDELSPPSSPKVKGVVEKSDSVSYVLEIEESPEIIANRIVRRSFRNPTPPKTTPTKSPANKRPRIKNSPLSLSASASSIVPANSRSDTTRSRSASVRDDPGSANSNTDEVFTWHVPVSNAPQKYSNGKSCEHFCDDSNVDLDDFNEEDIKLPALPSEIGRNAVVQSLPVPKHLAGEAMVSESNSEDESSASTSSGQL